MLCKCYRSWRPLYSPRGMAVFVVFDILQWMRVEGFLMRGVLSEGTERF